MRIYRKVFTEWSDARQQELRKLTLKDRSVLFSLLQADLNTLDTITTWVAIENHKAIAWAVLTKDCKVMIYVNIKFRRVGIGRKLIKRISVDFLYKKLRVYGWDRKSNKFYINCIPKNWIISDWS